MDDQGRLGSINRPGRRLIAISHLVVDRGEENSMVQGIEAERRFWDVYGGVVLNLMLRVRVR